MRILLDTNAYSGLKRGHRETVEMVRRSERILFSPIVAGELFHGFRQGSRYEHNATELTAFLDNPYVEVVPVSLETADRFGRITSALRQKGTPIPTNDIWIAAQAMETGAYLVSGDGHFAHVDGLTWLDPQAREITR